VLGGAGGGGVEWSGRVEERSRKCDGEIGRSWRGRHGIYGPTA
jgi:hypothetical protein